MNVTAPRKDRTWIVLSVLFMVLAGLIVALLIHLAELRRVHESVREWVLAVERLEASLSAARNLDKIATQLTVRTGTARNDLHFEYLEQYLLFSKNLRDPRLLTKLSPETRRRAEDADTALRYRETLDPAAARVALATLLPPLEATLTSHQARKRAAFTAFHESVGRYTTPLSYIAVTILLLLLATGAGLAFQHRRQQTPPPASASSNPLLTGSEDERRRIAMDLHDQILADLTAVRRDLQGLRDSGSAHGKTLTDAEAAIGAIADDIRRIMDDLHPPALDMLGLEPALRSHLARFENQPGSPAFQLFADDGIDTHLDPPQRVHLYRIALEAIHNAMRHSRGSRGEVVFRLSGNDLVLSVEDNGCGFDHPLVSGTGRGLSNIEQRAGALGATVRWTTSRFSRGTRFELRLPFTGTVKPVSIRAVPS